MSLQQVLDQVEFYTSTSAWQPISSGNPISFVTPSDQHAILSYIADLYNNSPIAAGILDDYVTSGKPIQIADAISSNGTNAQPGFFDPPGDFLAYDPSSIGDLYYFNSNGEIDDGDEVDEATSMAGYGDRTATPVFFAHRRLPLVADVHAFICKASSSRHE